MYSKPCDWFSTLAKEKLYFMLERRKKFRPNCIGFGEFAEIFNGECPQTHQIARMATKDIM